MSVLQRIRSHGVLLLVIVGAAMLAFVLGDFLNSGSSFFNRKRQYVGTIAGEKIHYTDYEALREQITDVYKIEYGRSDFDEQTHTAIRSQVWQYFLLENILRSESEKIGLTVTPDELSNWCIGTHPHPLIQQRRMFCDQEGHFNRQQLLSFLNALDNEQAENIQQAKSYWNYWEKTIRLSVLQEKYVSLIGALYTANNIDAKYAVIGRDIKRDVKYVSQPYYGIADSLVSVSHSDVKKLYSERKALYKQQPHRAIQYVTFPIKPSTEDFDEAKRLMEELVAELKASDTENDIASLVNANSDTRYEDLDLSKDDLPKEYADFAFDAKTKQLDMSTLSFKDNVYSIAKVVDKGYSKSDSVHLKLLAQGEQKEEDLGWFTERSLSRELIDSAFNLPKGAIFHVTNGVNTATSQQVEIVEKSKPTPKVKLAILSHSVNPSSVTYSTIYNTAKQFAVQVGEKGDFTSCAKEHDLTIYPAYNVQKSQEKIAALQGSRAIIRWAFEAKEDQVSDVFDCTDAYVIAHLTDINEDEYRPLEDVQYELLQLVRNQKKAAYVRNQWKGLTSLEDIAKVLHNDIDTATDVSLSTQRFGNSGIEPAVIGTAMAIEKDIVSEPIEGELGIFVLQAGEKKGVVGEIDYTKEISQLNSATAYPFTYQVMEYLSSEAEIDDNRAMFY